MQKLFASFVLWSLSFSITLTAQITTGWFSSIVVAEGVWQISDHGSDNIYVIEGRDSAMLIDTGLGVADLAACVRRLTSKPLIVVNTHGHPDHAGSNYQFSKVYIHHADSSAVRACNTPQARAAASKNMIQGSGPSENELYRGRVFYTTLAPVSEGKVFDLGGRKIEVIETPGHTPGGICLLDVSNRLLFSGDNNNTLVWLFLPNCRPLSEYLKTLEKQASLLAGFTMLMPGHGPPIASDFIHDQVACVKGILDGTIERKPYKSFAGESLVATFGRASVAFNPDNL